jgi:uncharacterized protein YdcH (DUF465 family)
MDLLNNVLILTEELRKLAAEHTQLEQAIKDANPHDEQEIKRLKKQKVLLKDKMAAMIKSLPRVQFLPTDPKLFALTDSELQLELSKRQRMLNRRKERVGERAAELTILQSKLRDVELEIDRRELEAMFAEEPLSEAA